MDDGETVLDEEVGLGFFDNILDKIFGICFFAGVETEIFEEDDFGVGGIEDGLGIFRKRIETDRLV